MSSVHPYARPWWVVVEQKRRPLALFRSTRCRIVCFKTEAWPIRTFKREKCWHFSGPFLADGNLLLISPIIFPASEPLESLTLWRDSSGSLWIFRCLIKIFHQHTFSCSFLVKDYVLFDLIQITIPERTFKMSCGCFLWFFRRLKRFLGTRRRYFASTFPKIEPGAPENFYGSSLPSETNFGLSNGLQPAKTARGSSMVFCPRKVLKTSTIPSPSPKMRGSTSQKLFTRLLRTRYGMAFQNGHAGRQKTGYGH